MLLCAEFLCRAIGSSTLLLIIHNTPSPLFKEAWTGNQLVSWSGLTELLNLSSHLLFA